MSTKTYIISLRILMAAAAPPPSPSPYLTITNQSIHFLSSTESESVSGVKLICAAAIRAGSGLHKNSPIPFDCLTRAAFLLYTQYGIKETP